MKQMIVFSIVLLLATALICCGSTLLIHKVLDRMEDIHEQALSCTDIDDAEGALVALTQLAQLWSEADYWMEMLTDHADIHNVREQIVSAKALLEHDDIAQYHQSMALVREGLDHIRRSESLSLSNLF